MVVLEDPPPLITVELETIGGTTTMPGTMVEVSVMGEIVDITVVLLLPVTVVVVELLTGVTMGWVMIGLVMITPEDPEPDILLEPDTEEDDPDMDEELEEEPEGMIVVVVVVVLVEPGLVVVVVRFVVTPVKIVCPFTVKNYLP